MTLSDDDDRLTIDDIISAGGCAWGARAWFKSMGGTVAGLDLKTFLNEGISIADARALNDGLVNRAIELKERRNGRG